MLKHPIWKPLTFDLLRNKSGSDLICRIVKYENKEFGIEEPTGMRMPVYNKYFIIRNPQARASILRRGRALYSDKISRRVNRMLRQHRTLSDEYLSTVTVGSKRIIPKKDKRAKVIKNLNLTKNIKVTKINKVT
jgi:hypothetical protein